jgi:hypothetical protein
VNNGAPKLEFDVKPLVGGSGLVMLRVSARQAGATSIAIRQNSREVGRIDGEEGEIDIAAISLGRGPTTLQAVSEGPAPTFSQPVALQNR